MKKNTIWNKIFHCKEIKANQALANLIRERNQQKDTFIKGIERCKTLGEVLDMHKIIYTHGFEHPNLGRGTMFRCQSVVTMTPYDVYLGGIYGLNTASIVFWESYRDEPYGVNGFGIREDYPMYQLILNQYKNHLISNIKFLCKGLEEYELRGY